jgi:tRNA pseudouridine38-40 synthase
VTDVQAEPATPSGDGGLVRVRLDLGYDGTDFAGWAVQPRRRTVQGVVEAALALRLRLPAPPRLTVAGRTDAGVHALRQVAHVDVPRVPTAREVNAVLPDDVRIRAATVAPPGFDARFSAMSRRYAYRVTDGVPDPLRRRDTLAVPRPLDAGLMHEAARPLLGLHDFAAYCRKPQTGTTIRMLLALDVSRRGDVVVADVEADAFCHSMVRALVGVLLAVGDGRLPADAPVRALAEMRRTSSLAPAHALTLVTVRYPADRDLVARNETTRRVRAGSAEIVE